MIESNTEHIALKILSFVSIVCAYTFHPILWEGAFYHLTALTFVLLTRLIWLLTKSKWKLVALIMHVTSYNNLADEFFFDPIKIDWNEYLTLAITVTIIYYNREKWMNCKNY